MLELNSVDGEPDVARAGGIGSAPHADVDPELERELAQAAEDQPIEVVLLLRESRGPRTSVAALLRRARRGAGPGVVESSYLPRMGALVVRACPRIIRRLIAQPEVELACANRVAAAAAEACKS
ncbi:MAG TPA: hypothetical protein VF897_06985 [Roseiflexaceae bacterium]